MEFVEKIKQKAKCNLKTIVLPEAEEERNLKAADRDSQRRLRRS